MRWKLGTLFLGPRDSDVISWFVLSYFLILCPRLMGKTVFRLRPVCFSSLPGDETAARSHLDDVSLISNSHQHMTPEITVFLPIKLGFTEMGSSYKLFSLPASLSKLHQ